MSDLKRIGQSILEAQLLEAQIEALEGIGGDVEGKKKLYNHYISNIIFNADLLTGYTEEEATK